MINTLIVNNDQEGAGNTEEAGADKDDHRDEQHEHEVGVRRLTDGGTDRESLVIFLTSRSR